MQINAIYRRSMIQTIAGKAIRDLRSGRERELRNVIELCRVRGSSPGYQAFWEMLEDILHHPNQQYGALLSRTARDVDIGCLKTLIANFGLHAYACGSETLYSGWESAASSAYWLESLDESQDPHLLHAAVSTLQEQGTSSFLLRVEKENQLAEILQLTARHRQCVFFLLCQAVFCGKDYLEEIIALGNVIPLIQGRDIPIMSGVLKQAGILFGFHRRYDEIESMEAEERFIDQTIEAGCFLGVYEGHNNDPQDAQNLYYYARLKELRRIGAKEILLADLWQDREVVQKLLLYQQPLPGGFSNENS